MDTSQAPPTPQDFTLLLLLSWGGVLWRVGHNHLYQITSCAMNLSYLKNQI